MYVAVVRRWGLGNSLNKVAKSVVARRFQRREHLGRNYASYHNIPRQLRQIASRALLRLLMQLSSGAILIP